MILQHVLWVPCISHTCQTGCWRAGSAEPPGMDNFKRKKTSLSMAKGLGRERPSGDLAGKPIPKGAHLPTAASPALAGQIGPSPPHEASPIAVFLSRIDPPTPIPCKCWHQPPPGPHSTALPLGGHTRATLLSDQSPGYLCCSALASPCPAPHLLRLPL